MSVYWMHIEGMMKKEPSSPISKELRYSTLREKAHWPCSWGSWVLVLVLPYTHLEAWETCWLLIASYPLLIPPFLPVESRKMTGFVGKGSERMFTVQNGLWLELLVCLHILSSFYMNSKTRAYWQDTDHFPSVLGTLLSLRKTPKTHILRRSLFWITVSVNLVHGLLALRLKQHGRPTLWEQVVCGLTARMCREKELGWEYTLPHDAHLFQKVPTSKYEMFGRRF